MKHTRHMDIYTFPPNFSITLIGAGGIGAITGIELAKMGVPKLNIYDMDTVEEENLTGQMHKLSDIGKSKAIALYNTIHLFADDTRISTSDEKITETSILPKSNIVISAVDSITARKEIWEAVMQLNLNHDITAYIDARMAAEQYQHFAVNMKSTLSMMKYWEMLSSTNEEDVEELPCTAKATFYTGAIAAGHIGAVVRNVLEGEFEPHRVIHYIPQFNLIKLPL